MTATTSGLTPSSEGYEDIRRKFFTQRVPDTKPAEIYKPSTTAQVKAIMTDAKHRGLKVGVRSGGHIFSCASLVEGGILIDTKSLNKTIEYDSRTQIASFSPGHTVEELATEFATLKRFFPWGHNPRVGTGGFLLAGGQGCFARGWGYTSATWVTQLEVVTAGGEVTICSKTENPDLFWAAPGSGIGFFGVITRVWAKTIPMRKIYDRTIIIDSTDIFKPLLKWVMQASEKVPKYGVELFFVTFRSDMDQPGDGEDVKDARVMFVINETIYADSLEEAKVLASPWESLPDEFAKFKVEDVPVTERTWPELWALQERFQPEGVRWNVDSIMTDPKVNLDQLIDAVTPALYELPTRLTTGTICPLDYYPDEADQALSLPQKCYVAANNCWRDPSLDEANDKWIRRVFKQAAPVSCGIYIADFNVQQRNTKVMTDSALAKWMRIRAEWDPQDTFVGYKTFTPQLSAAKL